MVKPPLSAETVVTTVAMALPENIGVLTINAVKSNVRGPIQFSTTKKLTNQPLESEWSYYT